MAPSSPNPSNTLPPFHFDKVFRAVFAALDSFATADDPPGPVPRLAQTDADRYTERETVLINALTRVVYRLYLHVPDLINSYEWHFRKQLESFINFSLPYHCPNEQERVAVMVAELRDKMVDVFEATFESSGYGGKENEPNPFLSEGSPFHGAVVECLVVASGLMMAMRKRRLNLEDGAEVEEAVAGTETVKDGFRFNKMLRKFMEVFERNGILTLLEGADNPFGKDGKVEVKEFEFKVTTMKETCDIFGRVKRKRVRFEC